MNDDKQRELDLAQANAIVLAAIRRRVNDGSVVSEPWRLSAAIATALAAARRDERAAILRYLGTFEGEISGLLPMITADLESGMHLESAAKEREAGR